MAHRFSPQELFGPSVESVNDRQLRRKQRLDWTEEISPHTQGDGEHVGRRHYLGAAVSPRRISGATIVMVAVLGLLFFRAVYLQGVAGSYYRDVAEGNRLRTVPITAPRGVFFDRFDQQLVYNISSFRLLVTPADLPTETAQRDRIITAVATLLGQSVESIAERLAAVEPYIYQPVVLAGQLTYEQAVTAIVEQRQWPGVTVEESWERQYHPPDSEVDTSLSHVIGYTGQLTRDDYVNLADQGYFLVDQIGKSGLEDAYETRLKGRNGRRQIEVDARGQEENVVAEQTPLAGEDLILTIDRDLQQAASQILATTMQRVGKQRGAVIVLDPRNGEIWASVSLPTFDHEQFARGLSTADYQRLVDDPHQPLFNRVIAGTYPSGSTIKPLMAAAALAEGIITTSTTVMSVGGVRIDRWFFPDWKAGGHGATNVTKAIAESVNTFFYYIGGGYPHNGIPTQPYDFVGLGPDKIAQYLKKFGLGTKTGVDLPGEADGFVPTVDWKNQTFDEPWYIGDTYNLSIGQGNLLVTPLQVASWTATVANGGHLLTPHFAKTFINPDGEQRTIDWPVINPQVVDDQYLAIVREGMRQTVLAGSAQSFAALPVAVAAKTGTAQWNNNKSPHAWFTAFFPYDEPRFVITVLVEEGEEGSRVAAPVARDLIWWMSQHNPERYGLSSPDRQ